MLVWLQSILTKRRVLLLQFLAVSLFIHTTVIVFSVLFNRKASLTFAVFKNINKDIPVVFDHLKKSTINKNFETQLRRPVSATQKSMHPKKNSLKKIVQHKSPSKKRMAASSFNSVQDDRKKTKTTPIRKTAISKTVKTEITQAIEKTVNTLNRAPKLNKEKITKPKEPEINNPEIGNIIETEEIKEDITLNPDILDKIVDASKLNYINQELVLGRQDVEFFNSYMQVQEQVSNTWTPPAGFNDSACELKASINSSGLLEKITVEKSSGAPAFDISAKLALKKIEWPKLCWNKEIIITFRQ